MLMYDILIPGENRVALRIMSLHILKASWHFITIHLIASDKQ